MTQYEVDFRPQQYYWSKLGQLKFDLILYGKHFASCVFWLRVIRIGTVILTTTATGAWMGWNDVPWIQVVSPIAIFILQIINASAELMPFESRKLELRELIDSLEPLYDNMEYDWQRIAQGHLTSEEIEEKSFSYQTRRTELGKYYFKDDSLPEKSRLIRKAKVETDTYLQNIQ